MKKKKSPKKTIKKKETFVAPIVQHWFDYYKLNYNAFNH